MTTKSKTDLLCMMGEVSIMAANGEPSGPPEFEVVAYTGGAMTLAGWDQPIVIDLEGMSFGNSLVANLDHDSSKRVGNVTSQTITDGRLVLSGVASAATEIEPEDASTSTRSRIALVLITNHLKPGLSST